MSLKNLAGRPFFSSHLDDLLSDLLSIKHSPYYSYVLSWMQGISLDILPSSVAGQSHFMPVHCCLVSLV